MKIKKLNELNKIKRITIAKKLGDKLANKFFKNTVEFNRVHVDYNDFEPNIFNFYFVFNSVSPSLIKDLEKLLLFFGWNKDGWGLQISDIGSDVREKAFYELHLNNENIDKYLEKFEIEDNSKKYNI